MTTAFSCTMENVKEIKYTIKNLDIGLRGPDAREFYEELQDVLYKLNPSYYQIQPEKNNNITLSLFYPTYSDLPDLMEKAQETLEEGIGGFLDENKGQIKLEYFRQLPWDAYIDQLVKDN